MQERTKQDKGPRPSVEFGVDVKDFFARIGLGIRENGLLIDKVIPVIGENEVIEEVR